MVSAEQIEFQRIKKEATEFLQGEPKEYGEIKIDELIVTININKNTEEVANIAEYVQHMLEKAGARHGWDSLLGADPKIFRCVTGPEILEKVREQINQKGR